MDSESKIEMLNNVLNDYNNHECVSIELSWNGGGHSLIENKEVINKIMDFLKMELREQINEELR